MNKPICDHLKNIKQLKKAEKYECEECIKTSDRWVHLRVCQECGVTLCCDNSFNKHASKHAHQSGHPVISSAEPGEKWLYCYEDKAYLNY